MKAFSSLLLVLSLFSVPSLEAKENGGKASAKKLVKSLLAWGAVSKGSRKDLGDFSAKGCKGNGKDWLNLLLTGKSFTATYEFSEACDVQGTWRPKLDKFFPAKFKTKDLDGYNLANFDFLIRFKRSLTPKIDYTISNGLLKSEAGDVIRFKATYSLVADLAASLAQQKVVPQSHSGELVFQEINGKKVNLREPIQVNY